jgi:uncharacterized cupredoxin-like copper-binding protein
VTESWPRTALLVGVASVVLGVGTTGALALATGGGPPPAQPALCAPPALPGSVVDVALTDMGDMMGPGMMGPGMNRGMMGHGMNAGMAGMMSIAATPMSVPAGPVSLRVANRGGLTHEAMVMPLAAGRQPGQRPVGADGRVDEEGSLGEAAQTCGAGEGDGIAPGSWSWITVNLPAGRYELICNIPGHYGSGMYAELDVK